MRQPINRGIPKPLMRNVFATPLFQPPATADETYWLTAFYRPTVGVSQDVMVRYLQGSALPFEPYNVESELSGSAVKLFAGLPLRGSNDRAELGFTSPSQFGGARGLWYGHVEVGEEEQRLSDRPLVAGRPDDTFVLSPIHLSKQDPAVLVHTLDLHHVDLVTLHLLVPPEMELELRFFDGTYRNGQAQYQAHVVRNENQYQSGGVGNITGPGVSIDELFFDRHPMRGPGSIQAVVKAADSDDDRAFIYGTVFR